MPSAISYGPEGSIEEYWAKMSATYAEVENGNLDDQFEKEFADDIFDVFRKSGSDDDGEDSDQSGGGGQGGEDQGVHTLLSFAQGMMEDDDDDDYNEDDDDNEDDDYNDDDDDDDDSGIDLDTHAGAHHHTPSLQGSSGKQAGSSGHSQQPARPSPADMRQLALAYEIEESDDDEDEEEKRSGVHQGGAAGFLMGSDDDEDSEGGSEEVNVRRGEGKLAAPRQQQAGARRRAKPREAQQPPPGRHAKPSHPFLRQESGGGEEPGKRRGKHEVARKHKVRLTGWQCVLGCAVVMLC